jgi:hypothetical protein
MAAIGLIGYASLVVAFALLGKEALLGAAFAGLAGFGFSLYPTCVELFVTDAICRWRVASAVVMTTLAPVAIASYLRGPTSSSKAGEPASASTTSLSS